MCMIAVFAAFISAMAQVSIPLPSGVPVTLQTFAVSFAAVVLGGKKGLFAALVYVLLGACGAPVFAGLKGGMGSIIGPTGGFILSFPLMAFLAGRGAEMRGRQWLWLGLAAGAAANYLVGALVFTLITLKGFSVAFTACVLPFLPGDLIKLALAGFAGEKCRRLLGERLRIRES